MIQIQKNIPMPAKRQRKGSGAAEVFRKMQPGDSVFIEGSTSQSIASSCLLVFGKGAYITRTEADGVRVWRAK